MCAVNLCICSSTSETRGVLSHDAAVWLFRLFVVSEYFLLEKLYEEGRYPAPSSISACCGIHGISSPKLAEVTRAYVLGKESGRAILLVAELGV